MTKREFYQTIANGKDYPAEMVEFAAAELEKMDNSAAARAAKPSKARIENEGILNHLLELNFVGAEPRTASDVAEVLEVKSQKATAVLKLGVDLGHFTVTDVKIPKRGTVKAYTLAMNGFAEEAEAE